MEGNYFLKEQFDAMMSRIDEIHQNPSKTLSKQEVFLDNDSSSKWWKFSEKNSTDLRDEGRVSFSSR